MAADLNERQERVNTANKLIWVISSRGRRFFYSAKPMKSEEPCIAKLSLGHQGRVWFTDDYSGQLIYTHHAGAWKGFTHGGTLKKLIETMRDWIMGKNQYLSPGSLGPWPDWYCDGNLWGYGDDMESVRRSAAWLNMIPKIE